MLMSSDSEPGEHSTQDSIIGIFREVLQIEDIEGDSDFFHLGGHSLLAIRVIARIDSQMGIKLSVRALFDNPTPNQLATYLNKLGK